MAVDAAVDVADLVPVAARPRQEAGAGRRAVAGRPGAVRDPAVQEDEARRTYESLREMSQLDELDWMRETADLGLAAFDQAEAPDGGVA